MALLRRRAVFAAKIESTAGTAETLTNAEGVYVARDFSIVPNIGMTRREGQGGFAYLASVPEGMQATCTITHDLTYDGDTLPNWASVLLPACGFVESSGVFAPVSRAPGGAGLPKTLTIGHYHDGKLRVLSGAMGTFVINASAGQVASITFTFTGKYHADETDAALLTPTYPTALPLRFADGSVSWASANICVSTVAVDAGNSVVLLECVQSGNRTGYKHAVVANRAPVITADPEAVLVATQNRDNQWLSMTTGALTITMNGPSGSSVVISAPAAQIENKQPGNRNDVITDQLTWLATQHTTPDSELTITFNEST